MSGYIEDQVHRLVNKLEKEGYTAHHLKLLEKLDAKGHQKIKAFLAQGDSTPLEVPPTPFAAQKKEE